MKDLEGWAAVQKVCKQTKCKRATAKILNISRNTVKRLLNMTEPPVYHRTDYSSKMDEYKELIIVWRCDPYNFNGTRISKKATVRHESPPGDQAQFDWKECKRLSKTPENFMEQFLLQEYSNKISCMLSEN